MNVTNATIHERSASDTYTSPSPRSVAPHLSSEYERFPSLDEARANGHLHQVASPVEITPTQAVADKYKWPTRKSSQMVRENGRISGVHTHRPRRSVSDAIRNLRERRGSVSENAHELAEALKAPVSYRLVVRSLQATTSAITI
jgi:solute carrier family 35, member E1